MENENNFNFEDAMKKLEEIANELEKNDLDLDSSVSKFEEGMKSQFPARDFDFGMLEDAEKRISILINTEDGIVEEDFE